MNQLSMDEIQANQRLENTLNDVAKVLGSVIGPDCFRMLRLRVRVGEYEPSMTVHGGAQIWMPRSFYNTALVGNEPLAIGLMAHEMSHFMQPLVEVEELIERGLIPHWFSNVVLDVAGESFIQKLLPAFSYSMRTFRSIICDNMLFRYRADHGNPKFEARLQSGLLAARYCRPEFAYYKRYSIPGEYRINEVLADVAKALDLKPAELPAFLLWLSEKYPELRKKDQQDQGEGEGEDSESGEKSESRNQQGQGEGNQQPEQGESEQGEGEQEEGEQGEGEQQKSGSGQGEDDEDEKDGESKGGEAKQPGKPGEKSEAQERIEKELQELLEEMSEVMTFSYVPGDIQKYIAQAMEEITYIADGGMVSEPILKIPPKNRQVSPEVARLAQTIQVRFGQPQGKNTIVAPGRMHRRELALGGATPYRMDVTGSTVQGPNVVICSDESGSMDFKVERGSSVTKRDLARKATQAVALSVVQAGGQAHGLIFATNGAMDTKGSIDVLWTTTEVDGIAEGLTEFTWLTEVWEKYPESLIVVITDGNGNVPEYVTAYNRKRTIAIVIPPGTSEHLESVCEKVVELRDVSKLSSVLSTAIPRTMRQ